VNSKCGLGATYLGGGTCGFLVWAPLIKQVEVHILSPEERIVPLEKDSQGYHYAVVQRVKLGTRYFYRLDGNTERPDPASKFQPEGVHGPSQVNDPHFVWEELHWSGIPFSHYVLYELHVGTFTSQGTFDAIVPHLGVGRELTSHRPRCFGMVLMTSRPSMKLIRMIPRHFGQTRGSAS
jgi:maltooligosyltrehalose trehalohydrolase